MADPQIVSDGLSGAISKLDAHFAGSDLTEIAHLQQQEVTLKLANLTGKDVRTLVFGKKEFIVEEIGTPTSPIVVKNFMVGDVITKVNGKTLEPRTLINNALTATTCTTVVIKRRSYASVPDDARLRNTLSELGHTRQKGFAYQLITCSKSIVRNENLMKSTFGFSAAIIGGKFVVVKISEHSAAEKFFSIGDALLDLNGRPLRISEAKENQTISLINPAFQRNRELTIIVERPVTSKARRNAADQMREHLAQPNTEPTMAEDATKIGSGAAMYHKKLWRKLETVSILMNPGHRASPKKRSNKQGKGSKRKGDKEEKEEAVDMSAIGSCPSTTRVIIDPKKSHVEIASDVENAADLEYVGSRYVDDINEKDDKKRQKKNSSLLSFLMK